MGRESPLAYRTSKAKEAITLLPMHIFAEQHGLVWDPGRRNEKRETTNETMTFPAPVSDWFIYQKRSSYDPFAMTP